MGRDLEGSSRVLTEILSRNFPGETEEYLEELQSGYPVSRLRFEPKITGIRT
jgi:hypothetical protein